MRIFPRSRPRVLLTLCGALMSCVFAVGARAAVVATADIVKAVRMDAPVRVDGRLDEPSWRGPSAAPFIQNEPDNGAAPRLRTDWWIGYDDENLYAAFRMHDAAPDSIVARLGRRDSDTRSDYVRIDLDTFNDDRSGFAFSVNAAGSIYDAVFFNAGEDDASWDGVWDCATRVDERGWTAEMRIPFSQLRFPEGAEQRWGVNVTRYGQRYEGRDDLCLRPRDDSSFPSRYPDLVGITGVRPGKAIEALVYATGRASFLETAPGDPFDDGSEYDADAGLDLKWNLSSDLTLNAALNPDFGQVEVDPAVVNLSDAETFFEERRPFFVEGGGIFRYGRDGTSSNWNFDWSDPRLFYSRRIGRSPSLPLEEHDYADRPGFTTILGAAKLTGHAGDTSLGVLHAVTAEESAALWLGGETRDQIVEPLTNYTAARLRRDLDSGAIGLMATSVQRERPTGLSRALLPQRAYSAGLDGWTFLGEDRGWAVRGYLAGSRISGDAAAIDRVQRSSRHYMDRPDMDYLDYDPDRTSLDGWAGRAVLNKERGSLTFNASLGAVSPGFDVAEVGFLNWSDLVNRSVAVGHRWLEPRGVLRNLSLTYTHFQNWDFDGRPIENGSGVFGNATFSNYWTFQGQWMYMPDRYSPRVTRGGPLMRLPKVWTSFLTLVSDQRRPLAVGAWLSRWSCVDDSESTSGGIEFVVRPGPSLRLSIEPQIVWHKEVVQWVGAFADPAATQTFGGRYVFSDMEYREFSLPLRVDWTFTPRLTLQGYVQPLFASADYRQFKEFEKPGTYDFTVYGREGGSTIAYDESARSIVVDPDGAGAAEPFAFNDPDFNFKSLKVNMVLRWEYHAGSTFYLVWTQDRMNLDDPGDFRLGRDTRSLLDAPGDDIVMIKLTRWLDF